MRALARAGAALAVLGLAAMPAAAAEGAAGASAVSPWLAGSLVFLAAAVLVVPLARALGLGSILGYLGAGLLIGPEGLALVADPQTVLHVAEFGVVLMLFLVGLELEPRRLWALRGPLLGWGSAQWLGCAGVLGGAAWLAGWPIAWAVVAALGLALSSTAIALQVLAERNALPTAGGQAAFAILLLQDVAAIPTLALIPLLAVGGAAAADEGRIGWEALRALAVVAAVIFGGRLLLRPTLRWIARKGTPEVFTAAALGLVVGIAALMQSVDLSMALGAFLAGVLLAESEYKRALETDVAPFKGLLLGLFFMAVGMTVDLAALAAAPGQVLAALAGLLGLKAAVLWALARAMKLPRAERPLFVLLLAQGGEFAFVVFQAASGAGVIDRATASVLVGAVSLSMLLTPLLLLAMDRLQARHAAAGGTAPADPASHLARGTTGDAAGHAAPVIIAGFGRYGQIVGRLLHANGVQATVLDHDAEQVETLRRFGFPVFWGDATRLDLLRAAGAGHARLLVLAIDDVERSLKVADVVREHFPQLPIVARARNVQHWFALRERGVADVERETLDAALMSGRRALEHLGWAPHAARTLALRFRRHSVEQLETLRPHRADQQRLVGMARAGRQQLEQLFAEERAAGPRGRQAGWGEDR